LKQVEAIDVTDLAKAKSEISKLQSEWVKIGHVPKDEVRKLEDRMRKVEKKISDAEADKWRRSDPAAKARSNSSRRAARECNRAAGSRASESPSCKEERYSGSD
jgi:polyhydroxyalkanoate synthesis regulator phasin